jgi:hypothetical protein
LSANRPATLNKKLTDLGHQPRITPNAWQNSSRAEAICRMAQLLAPRTDSNNVSLDSLDEKVPPKNKKYVSGIAPPPLSQNARIETKVTTRDNFFLVVLRTRNRGHRPLDGVDSSRRRRKSLAFRRKNHSYLGVFFGI